MFYLGGRTDGIFQYSNRDVIIIFLTLPYSCAVCHKAGKAPMLDC